MAKMIQVVATAVGFDGERLRQPDEVFLMPEGQAKKFATWFHPVDPNVKVTPRPEVKSPQTVNDEIEDLKLQIAQLTALVSGGVKSKGKKGNTEGDTDSLV